MRSHKQRIRSISRRIAKLEQSTDSLAEKCVVCGVVTTHTHAYVGTEVEDGVPCLDICNSCMGTAKKVANLLGVDLAQVSRLNASPYCCVPMLLDDAEEMYCPKENSHG